MERGNESWVQRTSLFSIILGITAGAMLGKVLGTKCHIDKILKSLKNLEID